MSIMFERKKTEQISVGGVKIGALAPVSVQSMCNTKTHDVTATVGQIKRLRAAGCEIVRLAIPDMAAAEAIPEIKKQTDMPLVADIHFDYRLALAVAERGIDKIRINPGNIGSEENVRKVAAACREGHTHPHRRKRRKPRKAAARKIRAPLPGGNARKRKKAHRAS